MVKTIWMFNQFAISPDMPGGTRHYDFAIELISMGYDVYIFASDYSLQELEYKKLTKRQLYSIENVNGINFVWVYTSSYKKNNWKRLLNWINFPLNFFKASRYIKKPDIVIGSSPQLFTAFAASRIAKRYRVKFISEIRDLWPNSLIELNEAFKYHPYTLLLYLLEKLVYLSSDDVIVFTESNREIINWKGVPSEHVHFISNGINPDIEVDDENALMIKNAMDINKFTLAYTGAIGIANNLSMMIDVAKELKKRQMDVQIVIVGDGPLKNKIRKSIESENLDNIILFEPISKSSVFDFLSIVDVCFITLKDLKLFRYGVSPNKLFDYMFAGKPVISAVGGWCNEIIDEAGCGIPVNPEDIGAFVNAVDILYRTSEGDRRIMGDRGREYVIKHFSRKKLVQKMETLF